MSGSDPSERDRITSGDGAPRQEAGEASSFDLLRRVIVGLIQAIGDGAELVSTSLAEELAQFRVDVEHRVVVILLMTSGIGLLSFGILALVQELIGSWWATLLLVGAVHVGVGLWLSHVWKRPGESK